MEGALKSGFAVGVGAMPIALALSFLQGQEAYAGMSFKSYQTHAHVSIPIDSQVSYKVEKVEKDGKALGLRVIVSGIAQAEDSVGIRELTDPRTNAVRVTRSEVDGGFALVYEFALTDAAKKAGIEYFDFRSKTPQEIQLDWWLANEKMGENALTVAPMEESQANAKPVKRAKVKLPKIVVKATLPENGFAGCGTPLRRDKDIFFALKVWHAPYDYKKFFNLMPADSAYEYPFEKPKAGEKFAEKTKEIAHWRLAMKLYRERQYALVLRTLEFFDKTYPKSELAEDAAFLRANTLVQLSRLLKTERYSEQAFEMFRKMILDDASDERARLSLAFMVQEFMTAKQYVRALEYALMGADAKHFEKGDLTPTVYRLAVAESLQAIGEHDRAERNYQAIIDADNKLSPEGEFRIGEVYAARKFWERAILAYERANRKNVKMADRYPTNWVNLAESYYRMDKWDEAARVNKEIISRFPNERMTWSARLRLAEIEQVRLKAPVSARHRDIETRYEDVVNMHPYTPGAAIATLRMAGCHQAVQSDTRTAFFEDFFKARDLKAFEDPLVEPFEIETAMDLTEARFFEGAGRHAEALKRVDSYRQKYIRLAIGPAFKIVYEPAVVGLVREAAAAGKGAEVLNLAEQYADLAPKPLPVSYELALTQASWDSGKLDLFAQKLHAFSARMNEAGPEEKDLYHLLKARQMRLAGQSPESVMVEYGLVSDAGTVSANKWDELADTAMVAAGGKGDLKTAESSDSRLVRSELYKKFSVEKQLAVHLRHVETLARLGRHEDVVKYADQAMLKFGAYGEYGKMLFRLRELRAEAKYDSGDDKGAVEALTELLASEPKPKEFRQTEFEYKQGKSLLRLGRETEALKTLQKVAQSPVDNVWKKSAQAELDQLQWENTINNQNDRRSKP